MTNSGKPLRRVAVYCGSAFGNNPAFRAEAAALGAAIAKAGLGLVYGGACRGLMGVLADAALAEGGEVIGVLPDALKDREIAHNGLTSLELVATMHERKARIHELSDAILALPGGFGTLDELLEAITWAQIGLHAKPCILINTANYWNGLLAFLDTAVGRRASSKREESRTGTRRRQRAEAIGHGYQPAREPQTLRCELRRVSCRYVNQASFRRAQHRQHRPEEKSSLPCSRASSPPLPQLHRAIWPRPREAAARLGIATAYGSYEELLADPNIDAIYNPLPNQLHVPWTAKAAEAGKHVLCEKPLSMTVAEAKTLLDVRARTGVKICEAFMIRSAPQWLRVRQLLDEGRIGEVRAVNAHLQLLQCERGEHPQPD